MSALAPAAASALRVRNAASRPARGNAGFTAGMKTPYAAQPRGRGGQYEVSGVALTPRTAGRRERGAPCGARSVPGGPCARQGLVEQPIAIARTVAAALVEVARRRVGDRELQLQPHTPPRREHRFRRLEQARAG